MYQHNFSMQESVDLGKHAKALVVFGSVEVIVFCVNGNEIDFLKEKDCWSKYFNYLCALIRILIKDKVSIHWWTIFK